MGLGALLGLDVGFLRALGVGALSLRALVRLSRSLGVVARTGCARVSSRIRARLCFFPGLWVRGAQLVLRSWFRLRAYGLAACRSVRLLSSLVGTTHHL